MTAAAGSLRAEVETAIRDRRLTTVDRLGPDAALWLAAPPLWSVEAARAASFPVESVSQFVQLACDVGWCKVRGSLLDDAPADLLFWMPDEVRREVMDLLRDQAMTTPASSAAGPGTLVQDVLRVAERVRGVMSADEVLGGPETEIPGALRVWANLMTGHRADVQDEVPRGLVEYARLTVAERALGTAQDVVAAGEAIAPVLAGAAEQALSRARRLLALGLRRRQDERALGRYLDRPELSDAVTRLLNRDAATDQEPAAGQPPSQAPGPTEPPWALHLRGAGGVGKTMLIRYLASGLYAAQRGQPPIRVARADFDHIGPDYPVRRPVQLLLELADELALHAAASDRADAALSNFRARAARAHEAVSGLREAGDATAGQRRGGPRRRRLRRRAGRARRRAVDPRHVRGAGQGRPRRPRRPRRPGRARHRRATAPARPVGPGAVRGPTPAATAVIPGRAAGGRVHGGRGAAVPGARRPAWPLRPTWQWR